MIQIDENKNAEHIRLYMDYVQERLNKGAGERFYGPYYKTFRQLESNSVWPAIEAELGAKFIEDMITMTAPV